MTCLKVLSYNNINMSIYNNTVEANKYIIFMLYHIIILFSQTASHAVIDYCPLILLFAVSKNMILYR